MENTRPNIESLKKADKNEKIVVISLLLISMAVAFFAFSRNNNLSASAPSITKDTAANTNSSETETSSESTSEMSSGQDTHRDEVGKDGVIAVGLFSTMENANLVVEKLDSLGFSGVAVTRGDGKIMVGVPANEDETELATSVMESYSDAFYKPN